VLRKNKLNRMKIYSFSDVKVNASAVTPPEVLKA